MKETIDNCDLGWKFLKWYQNRFNKLYDEHTECSVDSSKLILKRDSIFIESFQTVT